MFRIIPMAVAAAVGCLALAAPTTSAVAKECKADPVVQESNPYVSRSLGAFPSSLIMWRKSVVDQHGDGWQAWRRAEDRKIDCQQVEVEGRGKRWVCTRSARPCSGSIGPENASNDGEKLDTGYPGRLERFDKGDDVTRLQQFLNANGYELEVDGNFGRGTREAVRDFQRKEGLKVDGIVGRQTWERLTA
ncbi:MAG: peptidoglycan-binding domain-containing protein [Pseudomonadota bacterium]